MEDPENLGSGMAGAGDSLVKQYPPVNHQFLEVPLTSCLFSWASHAIASDDICLRFSTAYDDTNKEMASIEARQIMSMGQGGNTQTDILRELEELNERLRQTIILLQMSNYGCKVPIDISGSGRYLDDAIACQKDRIEKLKADIPSCDRNRWSLDWKLGKD